MPSRAVAVLTALLLAASVHAEEPVPKTIDVSGLAMNFEDLDRMLSQLENTPILSSAVAFMEGSATAKSENPEDV